VAILCSYVAATLRPISPDELSSADRGVLSAVSWTAIVMLTIDGVVSRERLDTLLRRVSGLGGAIATLGILQFLTGLSFTEYLRLPGLSENATFISVSNRDGFVRPTGTALHAIEFGVVLTMILPIAMHYAVTDTHRRTIARWYPVLAIALALPISISRSAILGACAALTVLLPTWPARLRRRTTLAAITLGLLFFVTVPGILGSILRLFTGISNDSSARSRTDSYAFAWELIKRYPLFGRGFGTFLPTYRILDNQYLGSLIEIGVVGVAVLLALFCISMATGLRSRSDRAGLMPQSHLGPALSASVAAGGLSFAFFDAFAFPMAAGLMFLMIGMPAALRRLDVEGDIVDPDDTWQRLRILGREAWQDPHGFSARIRQARWRDLN
jgi:O-antigen ligase